MSALRELQRDFVAVMLRRAEPVTLARHLLPGGDLVRRIGVYRVNARENFAVALEAAFPALAGQLGTADFRRMAWSYQRRHPSPSGNLFETGRALPAFLADALAGTGEAWLADLARLEWAVQEAMTAADGDQRFDPAVVAVVPPESRGQLRFALHPSARLLALGFPCFDAWRAHQQGSRAVAPATAQSERLLVRRASDGVELHRLSRGDFACLEALAGGATLEQALDAPGAGAAAEAAARALAGWAADGILVAAHGPVAARGPTH
ncbi:hypothetical protein GPROT2_03655 [Gammaproteobacteria bacterium]|nr:putative DNA-binding domain-containing protein [Gammaproteobacteria bacterium]QOJ30910.1 MAG: putative DNA-binding domain-containing protein [Gammaproteobacteria bacterium]CAG0946272.1 hypothetical protein GPROT2_03655 [Gammaproteobacteria bacterium]